MNAHSKHIAKRRCEWAASDLMARYHDAEWGRPVHNDRTLVEFLILESAQAGLGWEIVLKKRPAIERRSTSSTRRRSPATHPPGQSYC